MIKACIYVIDEMRARLFHSMGTSGKVVCLHGRIVLLLKMTTTRLIRDSVISKQRVHRSQFGEELGAAADELVVLEDDGDGVVFVFGRLLLPDLVALGGLAVDPLVIGLLLIQVVLNLNAEGTVVGSDHSVSLHQKIINKRPLLKLVLLLSHKQSGIF